MPSIDVGAEVFRKSRLELLTVGAVVDPLARRGDPFTGGNRCRMANDGDEISLPACLCPQNTEAVLGIMKGDALDQSGEHLNVCGIRLLPHATGRLPVSFRDRDSSELPVFSRERTSNGNEVTSPLHHAQEIVSGRIRYIPSNQRRGISRNEVVYPEIPRRSLFLVCAGSIHIRVWLR